jgi:proteasome lid subunit RPN8/RPN11
MSVHRTKPLPEGPALGHLVVGAAVIDRTAHLLQDAGRDPEPHEGLAWWFGRRVDNDVIVLACHRPPCSSGPDFVMADAAATGSASRAARAVGLVLVGQIHSHPGDDTRHSDGDDDLVLMPYEGMFSLVVARYGSGSVLPDGGAGLHQFQTGRWVLIRQSAPALVIAPTEIEL